MPGRAAELLRTSQRPVAVFWQFKCDPKASWWMPGLPVKGFPLVCIEVFELGYIMQLEDQQTRQ